MNACLECGGELRIRRENVRYDASGLPNITLVGIEVRRCRQCGEAEFVIPNVEGLHRCLASLTIRKRQRLTPGEVRFLRKHLGLSSGDFARQMGVAAETVSRWEQGATTMGATADRLLRWLVATREPVSHYPLEMLRDVAQEKARSSRVGLKEEEGDWQPAELVPA
jgi:putative transcriptional regulator